MSKRWENDSQVSGLCISRGQTYVFRYGLGSRGWDRSITLGKVGEISRRRARELALELRALVLEGRDPQAVKRQRKADRTLRDLHPAFIERWAKPRKRSWENDDGYFRNHLLRAHFADWPLREIDQATLWDWHAAHERPTTANRCLETLSKAMGLAKRWGWCDENPCQGIEHHPEKRRRRYATPAELERLLAELREKKRAGGIHFRFACLIQLLMLTGARRNEIMTCRWSEVDLERGIISPSRHKRDRTEHREIALGVDALRVIRELQEHEPPGEWLIRGRGKNHLSQPQKPWTRLKEAAGVRDLWLHDLRHTFASYLVSSGQTLGVIGELLGHSSTATTARYAHLIDDARRAAVDQAGALITAAQEAAPRTTSSGSVVLPFRRPGSPSGSAASSTRPVHIPRHE